MISMMVTRSMAKKNCKWVSGMPLNVPEKWNCREITTQNATTITATVYTRTHIRIPTIKCSNITRTICAKAFLRWSLSVVSDQIITPATTRVLQSLERDKKDLDSTENCTTPMGKCMTNTSVVLWNKTEATRHSSLCDHDRKRAVEVLNPENAIFQYVFDIMRSEIREQLKEVYHRSYQNRNNLLTFG
ncbi:unnamed protein product [Acanthocheilonema viteae]|uniref:Uncharacterized protein n=1 Tax=Acanthocheilonema viteae TaxID=6277 RepID=A0A498SY76_ACAVI|nr:unnamed protein product [Acanthocheilonema viteae]